MFLYQRDGHYLSLLALCCDIAGPVLCALSAWCIVANQIVLFFGVLIIMRLILHTKALSFLVEGVDKNIFSVGDAEGGGERGYRSDSDGDGGNGEGGAG